MPVHYAGVGCDMDAILDLAARHGLVVVEDAAQGVLVDVSTGGRSASFGDARRAQLPRDEERHLRRGRRAARQRPAARRARRDRAREGHEPQPLLPRRRSTSTPGSTSARRTSLSELNAAFLWAQLEAADAITRGALRDLGALPRRRSQTLEAARACCAGRSSRRLACTTRTCTTCCSRRRAARDALHRRARGAAASTPCSTTCRCTALAPAGFRPRAGPMTVTEDASARLVAFRSGSAWTSRRRARHRRRRVLRRVRRARALGLVAIGAVALAFALPMQSVGCAQTSNYAAIRAFAAGHSYIDRYAEETCDVLHTHGHYYAAERPGTRLLRGAVVPRAARSGCDPGQSQRRTGLPRTRCSASRSAGSGS